MKMPESLVLHIVLHSPENGFRFYTPSSPVHDSFFRGQSFPCLSFIFFESVVDFYDSVSLGIEALASEGIFLAPDSLIADTFRDITALSLPFLYSDKIHVLPHRTDIIILLLVVIQTVRMKRIWFISWSLFLVVPVVLDKGFRTVPIHETVVLFGTIP